MQNIQPEYDQTFYIAIWFSNWSFIINGRPLHSIHSWTFFCLAAEEKEIMIL